MKLSLLKWTMALVAICGLSSLSTTANAQIDLGGLIGGMRGGNQPSANPRGGFQQGSNQRAGVQPSGNFGARVLGGAMQQVVGGQAGTRQTDSRPGVSPRQSQNWVGGTPNFNQQTGQYIRPGQGSQAPQLGFNPGFQQGVPSIGLPVGDRANVNIDGRGGGWAIGQNNLSPQVLPQSIPQANPFRNR